MPRTGTWWTSMKPIVLAMSFEMDEAGGTGLQLPAFPGLPLDPSDRDRVLHDQDQLPPWRRMQGLEPFTHALRESWHRPGPCSGGFGAHGSPPHSARPGPSFDRAHTILDVSKPYLSVIIHPAPPAPSRPARDERRASG